MKRPWMKFYPSDWRADPALRMCSLAARGLWMEMLCIMHEAVPRGSLLINGLPVSGKQLASLCGATLFETVRLLGELAGSGVFSRDPDGTIFSRRMRADEIKSEEGRKQITKRWGDRSPTAPPNKGPNRSPTEQPITLEARDQKEGGDGDARATLHPLSSEAIGLADELAVIAGHDPKFVPPSWCGAAMTVQKWRNAGWANEIIRETVKAIAGKKRDGPAATVTYFERGIARAVALHAAPLPTVQVVETPSEIVHVGRQQGANLQATAQRIAGRLAAFEAGDDDERPVPALARG